MNKLKMYVKKRRLNSHPERDSRRKSLLKALSRRVIGTLDTIILSWLLTGTLVIALSIGGLELVTKTILYYLHERVRSTSQVKSYEELEKK